MKTKRIKKINSKDKGHSFLFWLVIPALFLWLSIGYILGLVKDIQLKSVKQDVRGETISSYMHGSKSIDGDLDQPFVTFWFDDAWLSQYMNAYPILKSFDFAGTIAVPTDVIETKNYVNWSQLKVLQEGGWEITNHSTTHDCEMDKWSEEEILSEYEKSKLILWKNKLASDIFVSPCGVDSEVMRNTAKKIFFGYRTVNPGYNELNNLDFFNLKVRNIENTTSVDEIKKWINEAKENKYWIILVFHKIGEKSTTEGGDQFNITIENFNEVISFVKSENIQVVTPSQILTASIQ